MEPELLRLLLEANVTPHVKAHSLAYAAMVLHQEEAKANGYGIPEWDLLDDEAQVYFVETAAKVVSAYLQAIIAHLGGPE